MKRVELDLDRFWRENKVAEARPFSTHKPRAAISLPVDDHWLLEEMQLPSTLRYYQEPEYRAQVNRQCNDRCAPAIGRRPFAEQVAPKAPLRIEEVFGSHFELTENATPWLEPGVQSIDELSALLDRIERLDDAGLRDLIYSNGAAPPRQVEADNVMPRVTRWSRGPATIATSVLGTTEYVYALIDYPDQMQRFYELLADVLIRYHRILAADQQVQVRGFAWLDDNCVLLTPDLYRQFCLPVMQKVFAAFAPEPDDYRFQHSDSAMGHLLPILATLNFHGVNFGPTLPAQLIRQHMPRTMIHGQVAPMTLRNGSFEDIVSEVKRDFAAVGADGGLFVTTAGSISAGTTLDAIRAFMWAVDQHTRYHH